MQLYEFNSLLSDGLNDILNSFSYMKLSLSLAWQDVRIRYSRSVLGPFWLTISMALNITTMYVVFVQIYNTPVSEFLPFLGVGIVVWSFISITIMESCSAFISSDVMIKEFNIPLFVYILRVIFRNIIIFMHNLTIIPVAFFLVGKTIGPYIILCPLSLLLISLNLSWLGLLLAMICTRYRDLPQIINSLLQVLFYITPIIWMPALIKGRAIIYLIDWNPLYYVIESFRGALIGGNVLLQSFVFLSVSAFFGWIIAFVTYGKFRRSIVYWL